MTKTLTRLAGLGALSAGLIFAQNAAQNTTRPAARRGHFVQRIVNYLNLTPDQQAQAKQIMAGARQEAAPLRQQMKQNREALATAIKSGNDAQIDQITKAQAPAMAQLAAIRAHAFEKIYATLTPEQKTKADNMRQMFHARRRG
jgi:Spy/CpxP family protein refolding chaperone